MYVCALGCRYVWRPDEGVRSPGSCEPPDVSAGSRTWVPCKSSSPLECGASSPAGSLFIFLMIENMFKMDHNLWSGKTFLEIEMNLKENGHTPMNIHSSFINSCQSFKQCKTAIKKWIVELFMSILWIISSNIKYFIFYFIYGSMDESQNTLLNERAQRRKEELSYMLWFIWISRRC